MVKYQNNIVMFPIERQMDRIVREATRLEKRSKELLEKSKTMQGDMDGRLINAYKKVYGDKWKTIIESTTDRVRCSGENNDHPLVYYTIGEKGFVVCGYCDLVFVRKENP